MSKHQKNLKLLLTLLPKGLITFTSSAVYSCSMRFS